MATPPIACWAEHRARPAPMPAEPIASIKRDLVTLKWLIAGLWLLLLADLLLLP
jgi:hypothetical protein